MKNFVVICLTMGVLILTPASARSNNSAEEPSPFTLAVRVGEPDARCFFVFSTSAGNYTIRHDGMGEITSKTGMRKVIYLKTGPKGRIVRLYFFEREGDVILLYEASGSGYLMRIDQKTRKTRSVTTVNSDFVPPLMREERLVFIDGTVVPLE